ncbi:hypothetical protein CQ012_07770 [Arthrobacter sp. MYb214]|nr:hypothetical protein CQ012_07770 [Arthrobacter sp. MYb214]
MTIARPQPSFSGRLKAASNKGVKRGLCAAWRCAVEAVGLLEGVPLCAYHSLRVETLGTVANTCQATDCTRDAERVLSPVGYMLCKSHGHTRWEQGVTGPWSPALEPELEPLSEAAIERNRQRSRDPLERFMENVEADTVTGCWNWTGGVKTNGKDWAAEYGFFYIGNRDVRAHIWAWENIAGLERDTALVIDHICRNTLCVRPGHMQQVSNSLNSAMVAARRREPPAGWEMKPPNRTLTVQEYATAVAYTLPTVNREADVIYPEGWSRTE